MYEKREYLDRQTDRQTALRIRFGVKRLWIGVLLAALSFGLCRFAGASNTAALALPVMFLIVSVVELECSAIIAEILTVLWSIAATFVTVFTSQLLLNESTFSLGFQRIVLNMALCGIVMGLLYLITAKLRLSVIAGMTVLEIFTAANYFVFKFRGSELCPADFLSVGTAMAVVDRYSFDIDGPFAYAVMLALLYIFAVFCISSNYIPSGSAKNRLLCTMGTLVMIFGVAFGSGNIITHHFLVNGSVTNGYILNFTLQIEENITQKPKGYDEVAVRSIEQQYDVSNENDNERTPDIIVIMNESFADMRVLGDNVATNTSVLPYYDSLRENVVRGYALCSVFGGSTPNSEYEFLTGNTMAFLPAGSIPYQQFINGKVYSITSHLSDIGYSLVATHPQPSENWLRYLRYKDLHFDEMYFIEDYPQENLIREYVSDQEMYEQLIAWYTSKKDESPIFYFGITMQNHGFYDYEGSDFDTSIKLNGYENAYDDVEQYLSLIHESDAAIKCLIDYFKNVERDVIILFYGDHLPRLDSKFYEEVHGGTFNTLDEQMLQYTVPFFIWANYDIEEQYVELTSLNFLSNLLLETAGMELPAYNSFLADVQEVIPAMNSFGYFSETQGHFVPYGKMTGIEKEILHKYQILQYNCIFDKEGLSEVFFPIHSSD